MTLRAIKVKGEQLSFLAHADSAEQLITGTATGETPTGWNFKVKGTYVYWVDDDGAERRRQGTLTGESRDAGSITVHGEDLYYGDDDDNERYLRAILTETFWASAGSTELRVANADYTTCHDQDNAQSRYDGGDTTDFDVGQYYRTNTPYYWIYRNTLKFDLDDYLGSVGKPPPGVTITAASIFLKTESVSGVETDFDVVIVSGANIIQFVGDEDEELPNFGILRDETVSYGSVNTSGWADETYKEFVLSAAAIAEIQAAIDAEDDYIYFGVRISRDISSTSPKLNSAAADERISLYQNDGGAGADPDPYITLTWS